MNKNHTSLERSKKLAEILPLESADNVIVSFGTREGTKTVVMPKETLDIIRTPFSDIRETTMCWSLAALLGLMPKLYEFENDPNDGGCQPNLCKGWDNNQWHIVYRSSIYITEWYDDPIDACVEMVCWLKENGKI